LTDKKELLILLFFVVVVGAWTVPVFPDPYYHIERVTFAEWAYREIDELIHGER